MFAGCWLLVAGYWLLAGALLAIQLPATSDRILVDDEIVAVDDLFEAAVAEDGLELLAAQALHESHFGSGIVCQAARKYLSVGIAHLYKVARGEAAGHLCKPRGQQADTAVLQSLPCAGVDGNGAARPRAIRDPALA